MKYVSFVLAACLSVVAAVPALASYIAGNPEVTLYVKAVKERTVEVALVNLQQESTSIAIQSLDGKTTYFQSTVKNHNGYRKRLNLKDLSFGRYLLVVEKGGQRLQQVIVLDEENGMLLSDISR